MSYIVTYKKYLYLLILKLALRFKNSISSFVENNSHVAIVFLPHVCVVA